MSKVPLRILLVEDNEDDYLLVRDYLSTPGDAPLALEWAATYEAGRTALARREHDIALIDYHLGAHNGLDLLRGAGAAGDLPPTIVLTGVGDSAIDAAAQAAGASDYLVKGQLDAATLERTIRYTLEQARQRVALADDRGFLQATLDALSAHLAVLDERGVVVAVNAAWRRFAAQNDFPDEGYGLGVDYLAVCDAGARASADGAAAVGAAIRDLLAGRRASFEWEYPCHGPNERRWFTIRIARFAGEGPTRIVVAHEDVSARHRAEERNRFQAQLLDQVPAAVIATDPAGVVTHWNAHATALYGWTPAEALGLPIGALTVGPTDAETGRAIIERVVAGEVWAGEFPVRRKDGTSFPAYVTDSAIRDEQGQPAGIVGVSVDISERKRVEDALRASERDFRELLEQAADAILILAPDGRFLTVNAQACALTGYGREELLAGGIADIMPPEEAGAVAGRLRELDDGRRTRERLIRRKDGTLLPAEVSSARLDDGRVQIIVRDIAARKAAETALVASEGRYRMLVEQASDGIVVMDMAGRFLEVNAQACAMLGYAREELLRLSSPDVIMAADLAERPLVVPEPDAERRVFERQVRRRDGTTFPVEASVKRLPDGRTQAILRDITERRAAAAALHAQHTFTAAIAGSLGEGVCAVDTAGRLTFLNPTAERLLGWAQAELLGRDMRAIIYGQCADESPSSSSGRPLLDVLHTGVPYRADEDHFIRQDGTPFPVTYTAAPILTDGAVTGAVLAFQDITARKTAEAELRGVLTHARCLLWRAEIVELPGGVAPFGPERFAWSLYIADEAAAQHVLPLDVPPGGEYGAAWHLSRHAKDFARSDATSARALREGAPGYRQEFRCRNRHGTQQWLAEEVTLEIVGPGRWHAVGICVDITARKVAEAELRANEARFRALVQQLGDVIAIADAQGILRYASPAIETILGYTPEAFVGTSMYPYVHPDDRAAVTATFERALANPGLPVEAIYRARHRDGSWRWFESSGTSRLDDPAVAGVVINARDITARVAADETLRQGAEAFASLFDATGDGMLIMEEGRIVAINHAYTALLGYEPDELIGRAALDFVVPADRATVARRIGAGYDQPYEVSVRRKDGAVVPTEVVGRSIRYHGRPGRLTSVRDITARKAAEAELRASEVRYRRLFAEAEGQARELALLDRVRTTLAPQLDERAITRTVAEALAADLGYARQGIFLRDGDRLVGEAYIGRTYRPFALPLAEGIVGRVMRTGRAELVTDIPGDPDFVGDRAAITSSVVVPLLDGAELLGALDVESTGTVALGETDLRLLSALSEQVSIALGRARRHAALRRSEGALAEAQRIAHLGSWEYDIAADRLTWSDEVFRIGGYVPQSFVPTPERLLASIHPDDRARVARAQRAALTTGMPYDIDHRVVRPDGEIRRVHQQAELIRDTTGRPSRRVGIVRDVTEQRSLETRLRHQAFHDALTSLPNRALFFERLGQSLARLRRDGRSCAVLFLDLDRFKDVNDTVGHDAGDRLLVAVAARLGDGLRDGDTLARLGGDEFTVLLEGVADAREAVGATARLLDALATPFILDGQEYRFTASIGVALGRVEHRRPEDVLRDADIAMYRAKEAGRGGYALFDPAMQAQLVARLDLERDLRHALERHEFALHYQPIIDLRTGGVAKVEALVRWQHPTRGPIPPLDFIPLAEETGLIRTLGRWVLGEACRQARAWQVAGTPVAVAVNLTALEFQHPDLADEVAAALMTAGIEARWLRLEITESLAMRDVAATIATVGSLRAMGVATAIDDFGTGYSSLAYLKRLPVSALKVDKAFIDGLGTDEEDTAIAAAIITLGHTLGLQVIAEGVETAEQAGLLRALGCDQAQGYHFARPLPPAALAGLLARETSREARPDRGTRSKPITGALRPRRAATPRQLLPNSREVAPD